EAPGAVQLTYTFADRCGSPLGLAIVSQISRENRLVEPESLLWFSLESSQLPPRTPGEPAQAEVRLLRHDLASDLVAEGSGSRLELELSNAGVPAPAGEPRLLIDDLAGPAAHRGASASLASLAKMVEGSHCRLETEDLEALPLLARVLRVRICDDVTAEGSPCYPSALTLFRDLFPGSYRLDLRVMWEEHGLLHLGLDLLRDPTGRPKSLHYRVLPHSTLAKSANVFFTHPRPRGEILQSSDPGFAGLRYTPPLDPKRLGSGTVDLEALLGTAPAASGKDSPSG
ncbi:MAG: hypothetical protein KDD47_18205, partial [Acidobacteria bacterium]|nr:hypothetical protein [Acidobacteriota bacterium]